MPPAGFKPTIPTNERPQTNALECETSGTGKLDYIGTHKMGKADGQKWDEVKILKIKDEVTAWKEHYGAILVATVKIYQLT